MRVIKPADQERPIIRNLVSDLAEYYSIKLTEKQIDMYVEDLMDMGSDETARAMTEYRREWNSKTFPLPAALRKQIWFGVAC